MERFDVPGVVQVLDEGVRQVGLDATVDDVIFPALRIAGAYWTYGSFNVAHAHLLTRTVTRWLDLQLAQQQVRRTGSVLVAAGPQDLHTVGLDCLQLLLAHRGVDVCNLGAQTPADAAVIAARALDVAAVVIYAHLPSHAGAATETIRAVSQWGVPVYYAGACFDSLLVRRGLPGTPLESSVAAAADLITRQHTRPGAVPYATNQQTMKVAS